MQIRGMLTNTRIRCGDPIAQRPSDRTLLLLLSTQLQRFFNKTSLSGKPWAVDELTLTVGSGDAVIPADSSFGKPIQVRTLPAANSGEAERSIEFFELGEVNHDWPFPSSYGGFDGMHTAARMAFFRKSGSDQVYVRVQPPSASASYSVLYQIGVYGETTSLDETPMLPEHHALIEIRTAIAALPHCQWSDDKTDNTNRRKELALTLVADSGDLERDFIRYISTVSAKTAPSYQELPFSID